MPSLRVMTKASMAELLTVFQDGLALRSALAAVSIQAHAGVRYLDVELNIQAGDDLIQAWDLDFDHLAAPQAGEVMVFGCANRFVVLAGMVPGDVALLDDLHLFQYCQRAVDRGQADAGVLQTGAQEDRLGIQMLVAVLDHVQDDLTLRGDTAAGGAHGGKRFGLRGHYHPSS